uniref:SpoVT-AbrB domain-containing protein n=1 Tax=Saccharolobus islandicus TaxID=43080 RepID=Q9P9J8_SACIS|nr:hypothetical protein [Sulfolobus islandicus]3O27_A Chain A, The crystal structure of C68 from the hybrid virus-plasmid pSSVx [Sulfolobus islandicus]3O27_B Chain B, The crystal structure of C68 from the hybrid virus-plasmid pSSVx [Sulfolobus islandicus]CAB81816.1 hypothetical protein [Sulfolobus islandicus]
MRPGIRKLVVLNPRAYKGGSGHTTFYLLIPKDIAEALDIKPDDTFILNMEQKDGDIVLSYKRVKELKI